MNRTVLLLATCLNLSACIENSTYVLYRNGVEDHAMRVHVATFDASDGDAYNRDNCDLARELFQSQPDVKTKFWCEKGVYRK